MAIIIDLLVYLVKLNIFVIGLVSVINTQHAVNKTFFGAVGGLVLVDDGKVMMVLISDFMLLVVVDVIGGV